MKSTKVKGKLIRLLSGAAISIVTITLFSGLKPATKSDITTHASQDTPASSVLKQMASQGSGCHFPQSVRHFYEQNGYQLAWIAPDTVKTHASHAMLMLDCALQFGLNYTDYHPQELTYIKLNALTQQFSKHSAREKAAFDLTLTDALITYINHLHYGKLNPQFPAEKIDPGKMSGFDAATVLAKAIRQKDFDFMGVVLGVQPQTEAYKSLQYHLHLLTGLYTGDCYDIPDTTIRKMSINLERLRWLNSDGNTFIDINVPSYTLTFHRPDTAYQFKVIVGKPGTPTPELQSAIGYFTTMQAKNRPLSVNKPELQKALTRSALSERMASGPGNASSQKAGFGGISFKFDNRFGLTLRGSPMQKMFNRSERALSDQTVFVEHGEWLAKLLLKNDGQGDKIPQVHGVWARTPSKIFELKKAVPVRVTYFTCEVSGGVLTTYPDVYKLDERLETLLYSTELPMALRQ